MAQPIAAIILAAGGSSRMGRPKQLLPFEGESLIRHAARAAIVASCDPVIVVLGANRELVHPELVDLPVSIVENDDWPSGMGSSVRAGLKELLERPSPEAALLMLCDQPLVSAGILQRLIDSFTDSGKLIAAAEYSQAGKVRLGVPAVFRQPLFAELLNLDGIFGARTVIERHADDAIPVRCPEALIDLDTPDDYRDLAPVPASCKA